MPQEKTFSLVVNPDGKVRFHHVSKHGSFYSEPFNLKDDQASRVAHNRLVRKIYAVMDRTILSN